MNKTLLNYIDDVFMGQMTLKGTLLELSQNRKQSLFINIL